MSKQQDFWQEEKLWPDVLPERQIFCNRTMNMRHIGAIGFDMDYTLIHYHASEWEKCAFAHLQKSISKAGFPADNLTFDPSFMLRGLVVDRQLGNLVKANRFGYVKKAFHGTRQLTFEEQRAAYSRVLVSTDEPRFAFLNTLFAISEGCMYSQLVDKLEEGAFSRHISYGDLYDLVRKALNNAYIEGHLQREIMADPARFAVPDDELILTLQDLREAGKKLLLITNSDWNYTNFMMNYVFGPHLPAGSDWRSLFDLVVVSSRKPEFFSGNNRFFEVVNEEGFLKPVTTGLEFGKQYLGGNAQGVEKLLGLSGEEILYVGDHIVDDILTSKSVLRWRTCLIVRELEKELLAEEAFGPERHDLNELMARKEELEYIQCQLKVLMLRKHKNYGAPNVGGRLISTKLAELKEDLIKLDEKLSPLATASGQVYNEKWGPLFRVGSEESYYYAQLEAGADIYTSRVSNFLYATPYAFFRSKPRIQ